MLSIHCCLTVLQLHPLDPNSLLHEILRCRKFVSLKVRFKPLRANSFSKSVISLLDTSGGANFLGSSFLDSIEIFLLPFAHDAYI